MCSSLARHAVYLQGHECSGIRGIKSSGAESDPAGSWDKDKALFVNPPLEQWYKGAGKYTAYKSSYSFIWVDPPTKTVRIRSHFCLVDVQGRVTV